MRKFGALIVLVACGSHEQPTTTTPVASASATATATATATASATASATATATATAEPPPQFTKPLKEIVGGAKAIKLVWREKLDSKDAQQLSIKSDGSIKGILTALGADQVPQGSAPRFMSTFELTFQDASQARLATVTLYSTPTMSDSNKKYGGIDLPDGKSAGIVVADYADLQKRLKAAGANLP